MAKLNAPGVRTTMTKQDFIKRQQAMLRFSNQKMMYWLAVLIAGSLAASGLASYIKRQTQELAGASLAVNVAGMVLLFGGLAVLTVYSIVFQRRFGHRCPSCHKWLTGFAAQTAIATGNCGFCGNAVFEETPSDNHSETARSADHFPK